MAKNAIDITERVAVYFTKADSLLLKKAASRKSLPLSVYLRMVGVEQARKDLVA